MGRPRTNGSGDKNKVRFQQARLECLSHYSNGTNRCANCGEWRIEFLTFDHINAEPKKWNIANGLPAVCSGMALCYMLKLRNFPEGLQVLCMSCNKIKGSHITSKGSRTTHRPLCSGETKACISCNEEKLIGLFLWSVKVGYYGICLDCHAKRSKIRDHKQKVDLVNRLGGKCVCCGEADIRKLSFEHSNGDGHLHRKELQQKFGLKSNVITGHNFAKYYTKCLNNGDIWQGIEILCHNCNHARAHNNGHCPHEKEKDEHSRHLPIQDSSARRKNLQGAS